MNIAVIGSRSFNNKLLMELVLDRIVSDNGPQVTIISGGASGADSMAAKYARAHLLGLTEHRPLYSVYGKGAPFVRNRLIVDDSDLVVAFWDGKSRGTMYTVEYARKQRKPVHLEEYP